MLDSGLQQICNKNQTRVVDEDIDAAKQRQGLIGEPARRIHGAQISRHDITQPTQLFNPLSRALQTDPIPATDHQIGTCRRQDRGNLGTEAPGGACDQGTLRVETEAVQGIGHGEVRLGGGVQRGSLPAGAESAEQQQLGWALMTFNWERLRSARRVP